MELIKNKNSELDYAEIVSIASKLGINEKIIQILVNRGYSTEAAISKFLYAEKEKTYNPFLLSGMSKAVERIKTAINKRERILIFGDYDVDGISATAIMIKLLEKFGVKADFFLPNRFIDGYGITNETIDKIYNAFKPELVITVDCGISCEKEIEYGKSLGIDFVVTDHHEIPEIIPNCIVIDPKLAVDEYPFRELCGTGVAYKVAEAILGELAEEFLPIVAIATIADIVSLTDENRILVQKGLKLFNKYLPIGLKYLLTENKIKIDSASATDISFKIAPKLNASGRMGDAADSLKLYFEKNINKIKEQIAVIYAHNTKRQELCSVVYDECKEMLSKRNISEIRSIILFGDWDQGILGITCAKLMEEYNCPVFLFAKVHDELKGSARCIEGINVHDMLATMQDILTSFGGHTVAAGLTLPHKNFKLFIKKVNQYLFEVQDQKVFLQKKHYDLELKQTDIQADDFFKDLQRLEPCGTGNPKPLFLYETDNFSVQPLKNFPQHANINFGKKMSLICFNYLPYNIDFKLSKTHLFLIEFQEKLSSGTLKGSVKYYAGSNIIKQTSIKHIETIKINQFIGTNDAIPSFQSYNKKYIEDVESSFYDNIYGTALVTYSYETYLHYIGKFANRISAFCCKPKADTAFNTVILSPLDFSWAKNYKQILFLEPLLDKAFLSCISDVSTTKILVPNFNSFDLSFIKLIDTNRENFAKTFKIFNILSNSTFVDLFDLYNKFYTHLKIDFTNFYFQILVFKQLNIFEINNLNGFNKLKINKSEKRNLTDSNIYSKICFLSKIAGE